MKTIRIMADYYSFPLWDNSGNIDPGILPLSKELEQKLWTWAEKYDAILNMDDPASSDFKSREDEKNFLVEGLLLARDLKKELGKDFNIEYWPYYEDKDTPFDGNRKFTICM